MWLKEPFGDQLRIFLQVLESLNLVPHVAVAAPALLVTKKVVFVDIFTLIQPLIPSIFQLMHTKDFLP